MKDFLLVVKRFIPPYKKYLGLSIGVNILSAVLSLFSFAFIIPILRMLFKVKDTTDYSYIPFEISFPSKESVEILTNNFYWYLSQIIETQGALYALFLLGLVFILTTVLRTAAMYFSAYFMIPIRTGVVRDIRNQINDKIIALPLAFFSEERKGDILARVSGDVNEIEASIMSSLDMLFKNPVLILIYLLGMFVISWQLTVFQFFFGGDAHNFQSRNGYQRNIQTIAKPFGSRNTDTQARVRAGTATHGNSIKFFTFFF